MYEITTNDNYIYKTNKVMYDFIKNNKIEVVYKPFSGTENYPEQKNNVGNYRLIVDSLVFNIIESMGCDKYIIPFHSEFGIVVSISNLVKYFCGVQSGILEQKISHVIGINSQKTLYFEKEFKRIFINF